MAGAGLTALFAGLVVDAVPAVGGNPVRTFHAWYCGICCFWVLWKMPGTARFQAWFAESGLELARRRGLGHKGMPPFGFLPPPKTPPVLFRPVGLALAAALDRRLPADTGCAVAVASGGNVDAGMFTRALQTAALV